MEYYFRLSIVMSILAANAVFCEIHTVTTKKGTILGQTEDGYSTFLGVPYALVDEENPFGASLEYPAFHEPFNASNPDIKCPQVVLSEGGTIQCLTLNIYVPTSVKAKKAPVFVWFYGGGFVFGSAGLYDGKLLAKKDIIVVAVNYRLGPYGFFCLDDPTVPGNQGLKDQAEALRWIKRNIYVFGGNSRDITIAGESYGGGAVDLHLYSNYERLFNKAIIQSGAAEARRMFVKPEYNAAIKLAEHLGEDTNTNREALAFLRTVEPLKVMRAAANLSLFLTVCKEKKYKGVKSFITEDQFHLTNVDKIKRTSILIGYNSKETFDMFAEKASDVYANASTFIYDNFKETFDMKEDEIVRLSNIVNAFYLGGKSFSNESMLELVDMTGDFILNHAVESAVSRYIEQGARRVFKYIFSYVGGSRFINVPGVGAYHTEELQYLFHSFNPGAELNIEQLLMRERMTTMWSNFVKNGNPTPEVTLLLPVRWEPITSDHSRSYLDINVNMTMRDHVYHDRIAFWDLFWQTHWKKTKVLSKKQF